MVLAVGSSSVSMVSVKGRRGGSRSVSDCGVAVKPGAGKACPSSGDRKQLELVAVEHERRIRAARRVGPQGEAGGHPRPRRVQADVEIDPVDQEIARAVILEADDWGVSVRMSRSKPWVGPAKAMAGRYGRRRRSRQRPARCGRSERFPIVAASARRGRRRAGSRDFASARAVPARRQVVHRGDVEGGLDAAMIVDDEPGLGAPDAHGVAVGDACRPASLSRQARGDARRPSRRRLPGPRAGWREGLDMGVDLHLRAELVLDRGLDRLAISCAAPRLMRPSTSRSRLTDRRPRQVLHGDVVDRHAQLAPRSGAPARGRSRRRAGPVGRDRELAPAAAPRGSPPRPCP